MTPEEIEIKPAFFLLPFSSNAIEIFTDVKWDQQELARISSLSIIIHLFPMIQSMSTIIAM